MQKLESFAREGAEFVYGNIGVITPSGQMANYSGANVFIFAFNITATLILVRFGSYALSPAHHAVYYF